jgi:ATP-binding cassette subfamily B multidrug efflux pump
MQLDKIVVMHEGRIIETGTHDELLEVSGMYANLWSHQSGGYIT